MAVTLVTLSGPDFVGTESRVESPAEPLVPVSIPTLPLTSKIETAQVGALEPPGVAKPLKLFAVYPGSAAGRGRAVLGPAEASSRTYVVGALLENGAKLTQVFDDRAVLVRDRRNYTLYLQDSGWSGALSADTQALTVGDFDAPQPPLPPVAVQVTDFMRTVPAYEGDLIAGFRAYPGTRSGQFDRWGLQAGDLLVSAGGSALSDATQMEAVVAQLASGVALSAEVLRNGGERLRVTLDGSVLIAANTPEPTAPLPIR
jgi:hypothetical protein